MNQSNLIRYLAYQVEPTERVNKYAVAFLLTEREFRGPIFRTIEAIYAAFSILILRREPKLTLGSCQVSFSYWRKKFGKDNLASLLAVFNHTSNYGICCRYLDENKRYSVDRMIVAYNGKPSDLYVRRFFENLRSVDATLR